MVTSALEPTIGALSTYIGTLAGFAITGKDGVVGGYPARRLAVTATAGTGCPSGKVAAYAASESLHDFWSVAAGDTESIWVVQVGANLYLIAYRGAQPAEEARLVSSIEFIQSLPKP